MHQMQTTPSTTSSGFVETDIGNYMLYGAAFPHKGMLGYPLGCRAPNYLGQEMLFVKTPDYVRQIKVSSRRSNPMVVALHDTAPPSLYVVKTHNDYFHIEPSQCVVPSPFVAAVDMADTPDFTVIAFAVNNPVPFAPLRDQYSPIYLADLDDRNVTQCGFAAVKNAIAVNFWRYKDDLMLTYVIQFPNTIRTILRFYRVIILGHHSCTIRPWVSQPTIGTSLWRTPPSAQALQLGYTTPFTVDQMLCGVTDAKVIVTDDFVALVVAISNPKDYEESACPQEETLALQSDDRTMRTICGCSYAIKRSFVVFFNFTLNAFVFDVTNPSVFFLLDDGPDLTMEAKVVKLSCCTLVQLSSITGTSQLYTIGLDEIGEQYVVRINGTNLPSVVQSSTVGNCDVNNAVIGYHRPYAMAGALIYRISCRDGQPQATDFAPTGSQQLVLSNATTGAEYAAWARLPANRPADPYYLQQINPQPMQSLMPMYDDRGRTYPAFGVGIGVGIGVAGPPQQQIFFRGGDTSQGQYYGAQPAGEGYAYTNPADRIWPPTATYVTGQQPTANYYSKTNYGGQGNRRPFN